ncbi:hypothetical protein [Prescottella equi]|uniref:Putative secreted protein n=1 Tax=Rhodococcus hoagii TaxID=43767 RepID=A0A0F6WFP6_RHOHA|nr:hypothetical protein [Prescottella equi]AKF16000.1 putative secreted protein [Prescottella equi]AKG90500.1 putative secreted protein [Prescottella equi]ARX59647.1 putative secreted protein [Prescottella equi]ARX59790.1 putative secreted protein [Prescottella equi]ARX59937.1 putative secreted protein [Prescottella equi]
MNRTALAAAMACTTVALAFTATACGSDSVPTGTVSPPLDSMTKKDWAGAISIGVGNREGTTLVTKAAPEQVEARCLGAGEDRSIEVTAPNGWQAKLTHGSQIVTVKNDTLGYVEHDFQTREGIINATKPKEDLPDLFAMGITWDKPNSSDVEIQVEDDAPPHWTVNSPYKEFAMYMHIQCPN